MPCVCGGLPDFFLSGLPLESPSLVGGVLSNLDLEPVSLIYGFSQVWMPNRCPSLSLLFDIL
jgi:hypothetical protein